MLTSLYRKILVPESLVSFFSDPLSDIGRRRALMIGLFGHAAMQKGIDRTVPETAEFLGITRQAVYKDIHGLAEKCAGIQVLSEVPGRCISVTPMDMDKAILSLALEAHAPIEGIQRVLDRIYGTSPSIGYISTLLNRAGAFAEQITQTIPLHGISQGANDEIFDNSKDPVLTGVDLDSNYIYLMQPMNDRTGETWQLAMETLKDQGLNLKVAISDAGSGLLKGIKAAFPDADIQLDAFHVLKDIGGAVYRFREHILKEVAACYDMERAVARARHSRRASIQSKRKKLVKYRATIPAMVEDYDTVACLYGWLHELVSFSGYDLDEVMQLMEWLLDELDAVTSRNRWAYELRKEIGRFRKRLPATMLFLDRLFLRFRRAARDMGLPEEAFRLLYRRLGVPEDSDAYCEFTCRAFAVIGPARFSAAEEVHDRIIRCIKRASSMIENVNGRLRAYMNVKKHVSSHFYSLVQLHMNTKKCRRSRVASRKGRSPVEMLTGESWPELIDLFEERGFWSTPQAREIA